ncbi:hypothetical protein, partial [Parasutterella excrementihominis]
PLQRWYGILAIHDEEDVNTQTRASIRSKVQSHCLQNTTFRILQKTIHLKFRSAPKMQSGN